MYFSRGFRNTAVTGPVSTIPPPRSTGYLLYVENGRLIFGYNAYGRYTTVDAGEIPSGSRLFTVSATVAPHLRWDFGLGIDGVRAAALPNQVQLVGMSPWTGISVGLDARGPVSWDLRDRRGVFRYTGDLRSVTYRPGAVGVSEETRQALDSEAELIAQ